MFRVVASHAKQDMGQGGAVVPSEMNGRWWAGGRTGRCETDTHFFKMPMKMRSLELSLWFSSGGGAIVGGAPDADILEDRGNARQRNKGGRGPACEDEPSPVITDAVRGDRYDQVSIAMK